jgi:hypothetical protein
MPVKIPPGTETANRKLLTANRQRTLTQYLEDRL